MAQRRPSLLGRKLDLDDGDDGDDRQARTEMARRGDDRAGARDGARRLATEDRPLRTQRPERREEERLLSRPSTAGDRDDEDSSRRRRQRGTQGRNWRQMAAEEARDDTDHELERERPKTLLEAKRFQQLREAEVDPGAPGTPHSPGKKAFSIFGRGSFKSTGARLSKPGSKTAERDDEDVGVLERAAQRRNWDKRPSQSGDVDGARGARSRDRAGSVDGSRDRDGDGEGDGERLRGRERAGSVGRGRDRERARADDLARAREEFNRDDSVGARRRSSAAGRDGGRTYDDDDDARDRRAGDDDLRIGRFGSGRISGQESVHQNSHDSDEDTLAYGGARRKWPSREQVAKERGEDGSGRERDLHVDKDREDEEDGRDKRKEGSGEEEDEGDVVRVRSFAQRWLGTGRGRGVAGTTTRLWQRAISGVSSATLRGTGGGTGGATGGDGIRRPLLLEHPFDVEDKDGPGVGGSGPTPGPSLAKTPSRMIRRTPAREQAGGGDAKEGGQGDAAAQGGAAAPGGSPKRAEPGGPERLRTDRVNLGDGTEEFGSPRAGFMGGAGAPPSGMGAEEAESFTKVATGHPVGAVFAIPLSEAATLVKHASDPVPDESIKAVLRSGGHDAGLSLYTEEDGYYVRHRPWVTDANLCRMERRVLHEVAAGAERRRALAQKGVNPQGYLGPRGGPADENNNENNPGNATDAASVAQSLAERDARNAAALASVVPSPMSSDWRRVQRGYWFASNGRLHALPDATKGGLSRPPYIFNENAKYLRRVRVDPNATRVARMDVSYWLDVEIVRIEMAAHRLMIREECLAVELLEGYKEFKKKERAGLVAFYAEKLKGLEAGLADARHELAAAHLETDVSELEARIRVMEAEVEEMRALRDAEALRGIEMIRRLRELYAMIEKVRADQGFSSSQLKLVMKKVEPDADDSITEAMEREREAEELQTRLDQAEKEHGAHVSRELRAYEAELKELEARVKAEEARFEADCAYRRQRQLEELQEGLPTNLDKDAEEEEAERAALDALKQQLEDKKVEPEWPSFNEKRTRKQILAAIRADRAKGHLGSPSLVPVLVAGLPRDEGEKLPPGEAARRRDLQRVRLLCHLFVNGKPVGQTEPRSIKGDLSLDCKERFSLQVIKWPESVCVKVYEKGLLSNAFLGEVFLGVPGIDGGPLADPQPLPYQFTGNAPFQPTWLAGDNSAGLHYTAGSVYCQVQWGSRAPDGTPPDMEAAAPAAPPVPIGMRHAAPHQRKQLGAAGQVSSYNLVQWLKQTGIDPNDPRNAGVLELIKTRQALSGSKGHRINTGDELNLGDGTSKLPKRHHLIRLRWEKALRTRVQVPLLERYVDDAVLNEAVPMDAAGGVGAGLFADVQAASATSAGVRKVMEERTLKVRDFAQRIRMSVERNHRGSEATYGFKTEDVVNDSPLPDFKLDLSFIMEALKPRRKLRPARKQVKVLQTHPDACDVKVYVQKAYNISVRTSVLDQGRPARFGGDAGGHPSETHRSPRRGGAGAGSRGDRADDRAGPLSGGGSVDDGVLGGERVSPFVVVSFQGITKRTKTSEGPNPQWNELLSLPFHPPNGNYNPTLLKNLQDEIHISLFDEVTVKVAESESTLGADPNMSEYRTLARYLGSTSIPVGAVYRSRFIEGAFRLSVPLVNLGYFCPAADGPTLISLHILLKPDLVRPVETVEEMRSGEGEDLTRHAMRWRRELLAMDHVRPRVIKALAADMDGAGVLLCRFVCPLPPPPSLAGVIAGARKETVLRSLLRFVSMIPYASDWSTFSSREDVWVTCRDFLELCAGDHEEHALLLCNLFLFQGVDAYVVLGGGLHETEAAYVLTKEKKEGTSDDVLRIWNATTGNVVDCADPSSELREVGTVFNDKNIWANIQKADLPFAVNWDLTITKNWRPFFQESVLPPRVLGTVQTDVMYKSLPPGFYEDLEGTLERDVMDAITKARKLTFTHFNRRCSRILRELLHDLEGEYTSIAEALHVTVTPAMLSHRRAAVEDEAEEANEENPPGEWRMGNREADVGGRAGVSRRRAGGKKRVSATLAEAHYDALAPVLKNYNVGFPLCMSFTDIPSVARAVLDTGIHRNFSKNVEFAIAIYVHPLGVTFAFPIWVYVCTLERLRSL
eukprot:jgi/Mesvir1/20494/Mv12380-RA.1